MTSSLLVAAVVTQANVHHAHRKTKQFVKVLRKKSKICVYV